MTTEGADTVELSSLREVLSLYCRALSGRALEVHPTRSLVARNLGWFHADRATSDGVHIYLPDRLTAPSPASGFDRYKLLCTQQLGYLAHGSFEGPRSFEFGRPERDLFVQLEAARVEQRLIDEYPGLRRAYQAARHRALKERPGLDGLRGLAARLEQVVRASLGQVLPSPPDDWTAVLTETLEQLHAPNATVDTARAAARHLMNTALPAGASERAVRSPSAVAYRGDVRPDLIALLTGGAEGDDRVDRQEAAEHFAEGERAERAESGLELDTNETEALVDALVEEMETRESGKCTDAARPPGGPLQPEGEHAFVYDEWDSHLATYRPAWCRVVETTIEPSDDDFFERTVREHSRELVQIRRQLEMLPAEMLRKLRRREDGEALDLDAAIEAVIDLRRGCSPCEKLFYRHAKAERDVAVALLLDMSASTGEPPEGRSDSDCSTLDTAKKAITLLLAALEALDDAVGVYGFSGYGRENVEHYTVKALDEPLNARVTRRIAGIEPRYATRMGPAIRHTLAKLRKFDARTRLLFMVSDGRPQDADYGSAGRDLDYAVADTRMALLEARRHDIIPFCLTVDPNGHDYLRTMMHGMEYEVVSDAQELPSRLGQIYARLTGQAGMVP